MTPLERARVCLEGLSVGDAFGEQYFIDPAFVEQIIQARALRPEPWRFTDDTQMALSIFSILRSHGEIRQDALAQNFAWHYDPMRGYGPAMHDYLNRLRLGEAWNSAAPTLFGGQGSFGNGAAMRVAPIGAYFAEDLEAVSLQAARSAEVTHAHPEAISGAIAVALGAAWAWRLRGTHPGPGEFLEHVIEDIPDSEVRSGVRRAQMIGPEAPCALAVASLGNGSRVSAQDTVPFVLWCAARHLEDYEEALWLTVCGLGDRDTTCAMVGGIVAAHSGEEAIPKKWRHSREPLPAWPFGA